ncbi:hypothetical protein [Actinoplanes couchii]|uniref:Secreted protein n=1 Tax=Actinoplanes couchii TaxID=403638 RepID=A0ABQ3XCG2_9ACTN|nr:hypothetical protein [Actinoplanes couchii]MDR6323686.1 hypothetical protein [Actinoplanes couchii]GID56201.1 hypothetical protein Aco03nite_046050 [Actinoplanes couchii]
MPDDDEEPQFGLSRSAGAGARSGEAGGSPKPTGDGFRFAAVGALLIVVLFAGYGLGRLNNGTTATNAATPQPVPSVSAFDESQPHVHGTTAPIGTSGSAPVGGLSLSGNGLTLTPVTTVLEAGKALNLQFTINGPGGAPVTTFAVVHDKPLHLIVIRRDLTGFQHLHPVMAPDGTWSVDLTLAEPGLYRMIADFTAQVGGVETVSSLGSDLTVAGNYAPVTLPDPALVATAGNFQVGYEGTPSTQSTQPLLMTVTDGIGKPAVLEPYLGAFGHLVVLRQNDLGYVHVHPETQLIDGKIKFWLAAPSPGTYRMFLDFQVAGKVSTAAWTVVVS